MSAQRLSERKSRRIATATGLDIIRAWTYGHDVQFVTRSHQHGVFTSKTGEWSIEEAPTHFSTCHLIDATQPSGYREEETPQKTP